MPDSVTPKRRILIVEDNELEARCDVEMLPCYNCTVKSTREDGLAAVEAEPNAYSLLILDLRLPNGQGTDVIRAFRSKYDDLAILVTTGLSDWEMAATAIFKERVQEVLRKPYTPEQLRDAVIKAIVRKKYDPLEAKWREMRQTTKEMAVKLDAAITDSNQRTLENSIRASESTYKRKSDPPIGGKP